MNPAMPYACRQPNRLDSYLPWMASITFHLALGLIGGFAYYLTDRALSTPDEGRPVIVTRTFEDPAFIERPQTTGDGGSRQAVPNRLLELAQSEGWGQNGTQNVSALLSGAQDAVGIFAGSGASVTTGPSTTGGGTGAYAGTPGGSGVAPRSSFYGTPGNATKIVYLIDCTGSLVDIYGKYGEIAPGTVKAAVQDSVNNLVPLQFFDLIIFTGPLDGGTMSVGTGALARATPENKARTLAGFRDTVARGGETDEETGFIRAFKRAFLQSPDLIYFFTDGNLSDGVLQEVRTLNKGQLTHINAIMFNYSDQLTPADTLRYKRLEKLAQENGGVAKLVTAKAITE